MALPLGKKSLLQIERRRDPVRRIVELATLLEWLLRLNPPLNGKLDVPVPNLLVIIQAYIRHAHTLKVLTSAVEVRNRLVHCVPGVSTPSLPEIDTAARTFTQAIQAILQNYDQTDSDRSALVWQAANDPLGEAADEPGRTDQARGNELEGRVRAALWRLDVLSGYRAPFTIEALTPSGTLARLQRHERHLTVTSVKQVQEALSDPLSANCKDILSQAATSLEYGLKSLLAFDAQWKIAPGVLPLPAIYLEPDCLTRVRLLTTLVEHLLGWIVPRLPATSSVLLAADAGALFQQLIELNGNLLPEPAEVLWAVSIRNRLVRVVPESLPVLTTEVERAEKILWQAAFDLRRYADLEHADSISRYDATPLRTIPRSQMWCISNRVARLQEQLSRVRSLALLWEGKNPGDWSAPADGKRMPSISSMLSRHPWQQIHDAFETLDDAEKLVERGGPTMQEALQRDSMSAWDATISGVIHLLEVELGWLDRPRILTVKGDQPPAIQATPRIQPVFEVPQPPVQLTDKPTPRPNLWETEYRQRYAEGKIVSGPVKKIANFGFMVELEEGLSALVHISEIADRHVVRVEDEVQIGQTVDVMVIKFDAENRKIALSKRKVK